MTIRTDRGSFKLVALLASLWVGVAGAAPPGEIEDHDPPDIDVVPVDAGRQDEAVRLTADASDPAGVSEVTAWVRGEHDYEFRGFAMQRGDGGLYFVDVAPSDTRGTMLAYFVEAYDARGNGPARAGSPARPFFARFEAVPVAQAEPPPPEVAPESARGMATAAAVVGLTLLVAVRLLRRRGPHRREYEFWYGILEPLLELAPEDFETRAAILVGRCHDHPAHGAIRISREQIDGWAFRLRELPEPRRKRLRQRRREQELIAREERKRRPDQRKELAGEVFWLHMMAPLLELPKGQQPQALRELARRPHAHPALGVRKFDLRTLRRRLAWAASVDPAELIGRMKELETERGVDPAPVPEAASESFRHETATRAAARAAVAAVGRADSLLDPTTRISAPKKKVPQATG